MKSRKLLTLVLTTMCFALPIGSCINRAVNTYVATVSFLKPFFFGLGGNASA